jgi:NAD-dependent dihydropyrimidine dehydrogenase PreA subunit
MTIKGINKEKCKSCKLRISGCPVMDSCHMDVIRLEREGYPSIAYASDCDSCFACEMECPLAAVEVSALVPLTLLYRY